MLTPWGSLHTHSKYSAKDAMSTVRDMAAAAAAAGWGAMGLTDHGTVAGVYELIRACDAEGIIAVPGIEAYVSVGSSGGRPVTRHLGMLAVDDRGLENLIVLSNAAHAAYRYKPVVALELLGELSVSGGLDGLWCTTGCWFGLLQTALRTGGDPRASMRLADNMLHGLLDVFDGRVLVELQHHAIEDASHSDESAVDLLDAYARRHDVRTVITTDSHYAAEHDRRAHETLKRLSSWSDDADDAVFPGDGYWAVPEARMRRRFEPEVWNRAYGGYRDLVEQVDIRAQHMRTFIPRLPRLISATGGSPEDALRSRVAEATHEAPAAVRRRCDRELDVIEGSGFASYLLLTAEVTDYCRASGIKYMVRGSASGSMVCYQLGITQLDPIKWRLDFSRFLSTDRTKPPDIDVDVQRSRRDEVLDHMRQRYTVSGIGTWREMSESAAGDDKGSLWKRWKIMRSRKGQSEVVTAAARREIAELSAFRPYDGVGKHAAGVLIFDDHESMRTMPMQWIASSKSMVTALDKDQVESLGFVKLDVLGLATLDALVEMERTTGVDSESVPMNDPKVYSMIARGRTAGVFQLSGWAQRKGLPRLKPRNLEDVIVSMALFRPAVMESGAMADYLNQRNGRSVRTKHHELIERHVASTYGLVLFQEQPIGILRDLGLDAEALNSVLKAVKASNSAVGDAAGRISRALVDVEPLMAAAGFSDVDRAWLVAALRAYANYGFNRAHAVSYAHLAYRTAWFKRHHPLDYWAAVLNAFSDDKRYDDFVSAMRLDVERVSEAHVNRSGAGWTVDRAARSLTKGLWTVPMVGAKAAEEIAANAPYTSVADLAMRTRRKVVTGGGKVLAGASAQNAGGVIEALHKAGALEGLPEKEGN